MTKLVWTFLAILTGILLGLGLTALAVEQSPDFVVVDAGAWTARPRIGSLDADPYSKALLAVRGELPMGAAEGMTLTARKDSNGATLDSRCTYRFSGPVPGARYWTLTVYDSTGGISSAPRLRSSFTSAEVLRTENGQSDIVLSPTPQPGNWIPLISEIAPAKGHAIELALRLYDAQVSNNAFALDSASVPRLVREACQ